jgi:hypothetical protein
MTSNNLPVVEECPCLGCGGESYYGGHGIREGHVYDEYWCENCYHKKMKVELKEEQKEDEIEDTFHRGPSPQDYPLRPSQAVPDLVEHYYRYYEARLSSKPR